MSLSVVHIFDIILLYNMILFQLSIYIILINRRILD